MAALRRDRPLLIGEYHDGERPRVVVPLYHASARPVRVVRIVGGRHADQLGPVCAPGDRPLAAACIRSLLRRAEGWDLFLAERLLGDDGWPQLLGEPAAVRESSPVVQLDTTDWDEFLSTRTSNFRQQARKFERRLVRAHRLEYRLADDPARLEEDMATLFELHERRWDGVAPSEFLAPATRAFHVEFAHRALKRGWLRLWIAELDGRPAAAWYGFRYANAESFYQQGRDPALDHTSVGFVLTVHALREAIRDGMREYRFLVGGEGYKSRFATRDAGLDSVAIARSGAGRAAAALLRAVHTHPRIAVPLRRLLLS